MILVGQVDLFQNTLLVPQRSVLAVATMVLIVAACPKLVRKQQRLKKATRDLEEGIKEYINESYMNFLAHDPPPKSVRERKDSYYRELDKIAISAARVQRRIEAQNFDNLRRDTYTVAILDLVDVLWKWTIALITISNSWLSVGVLVFGSISYLGVQYFSDTVNTDIPPRASYALNKKIVDEKDEHARTWSAELEENRSKLLMRW